MNLCILFKIGIDLKPCNNQKNKKESNKNKKNK